MYLALLYIYFTWLALQNFLLPLAYQQGWLPAGLVVALMGLKEVVMMLALLALGYRAFHKGWRFNAADKFAFAYAALLVLYFAVAPLFLGSTVPFFVRVVSLRYLIALVVFYFWGRLSYLELAELRRFIRFVVVLQVAVALFGIVEWNFLPLSFWQDTVGIGAFMTDVKGLPEGLNVTDGLPINMVRSDIRRSISTYGDPLAMGIACVFPLLVCAAYLFGGFSGFKRRKWWIACWIIAIALLLTNGRESIAVALLGIALVGLWTGKAKSLLIPAILAAIVVLSIPAVWSHITDTVTFKEGSASTHLQVLYSGWESAPKLLIGKGLGEEGGWAKSLAGVDSEVGEDSYFELMGQAGLMSVLLLVGFLFALHKQGLWFAKKIPDKFISAVFLAVAANIIGRIIMAVFSPSIFAVVPMASFFFACGTSFTTMDRLGLRPGRVFRRVFTFIHDDNLADDSIPAGYRVLKLS
ncbi:MAG TPA: hypothetical protein VJW20_24205 [Candidatus Angelobacter sp.]|nr:hypothetical protein [Candidatus Angelobacter sp.]